MNGPGPVFTVFQVVEFCHDTLAKRVVGERDNRVDATHLAVCYHDAANGHPCTLTYSFRTIERSEPCGWPDHAAEQDDMLDLMLAARGAWQGGGAL